MFRTIKITNRVFLSTNDCRENRRVKTNVSFLIFSTSRHLKFKRKRELSHKDQAATKRTKKYLLYLHIYFRTFYECTIYFKLLEAFVN